MAGGQRRTLCNTYYETGYRLDAYAYLDGYTNDELEIGEDTDLDVLAKKLVSDARHFGYVLDFDDVRRYLGLRAE